MWFAVLGPLRVVAEDVQEPSLVSAGRLRALLAALLWHAGQPVPVDELSEIVWDRNPPAGAPAAVRGLIVRLRRALGPEAGARIRTRAPGYLIEASADEVDASWFEVLCQDVGVAIRADDWARASTAAGQALALWRGTPLTDVPSQTLRDAWAPHLDQQRVQMLEWRAEAELRLGRHDRLIPHLRTLIAEHPLRERFHVQLMLALYRGGRQAEALMVYQDARQVLIDQLGIEPGPELRQLHERVLAGDADLLTSPRSASMSPLAGQSVVPRQLPADVRHFVGRADELKVLSELLSQASESGAAVTSVIGGTAGIGKTALVVHWAHQNADRFPDGQLYVNLRGFDPSGAPVAPATAVRGFLEALGVPARLVPARPDDQAALYRSQLAERRMLVLLDNARDVEHVRPLLPGAPGCLVLVTSRDRLGGLVALNGAVPVTLDLFTEQEARILLIHRFGHERVLADERAAGELIEACARLPLALNIAAAHAALRPTRPLPDLVDELRDTRRRLDALAVGEAAADVRAVFSWSYQTLSPPAARLFRLLGLNPGPDVSLPAAAGLAALDADRARRALGELTHAQLMTEHTPGRYTSHDLLRAYAAEQADTHDSPAERHEALRRLCDFYADTAHTADRLLDPHRALIQLLPPTPRVPGVDPLIDASAAAAWLGAEHANLLAAQQVAAAQAWHPTVWQLAWALSTFHDRRARRHDALAVWQAATEAAAHLPDPVTLIRAHRLLGVAYAGLEHHDEAIAHLDRALTLATTTIGGEPVEQAHTHRQLARAWARRGHDQRALEHAMRALDLYRTLDQPVPEAYALNAVGWYAARLGDYDTARTYCQAAVTLHRHHDNPDGLAAALDSLGYIEHHTGHYQRAVDFYEQALTLNRRLGNTFFSADILAALGHPHVALGRREPARTAWQQALDLYRDQDRTQEADRIRRQLDTLGHLT
ncbi:BTAD domain-containing putative transcriptional regulator [Kutzneria buriramensis]|uniref:DNA-binding SARP family transcriptional activator n=1 Tax=Kutzneria buriramensis TaxID=1045776 RepID=A0A3E0HIE3_9PSEU|nr:BTAD domain-containing putative transcriptional regulator [Kutzneria buriramensis]REH46264.1 DNA-binding SARP family transcriptional activator [Kutzneria buriramensis]